MQLTHGLDLRAGTCIFCVSHRRAVESKCSMRTPPNARSAGQATEWKVRLKIACFNGTGIDQDARSNKSKCVARESRQSVQGVELVAAEHSQPKRRMSILSSRQPVTPARVSPDLSRSSARPALPVNASIVPNGRLDQVFSTTPGTVQEWRCE